MLLLFFSLGGAIYTTPYKIFMFVYFLVPGFLALYYSKKDKIKLPIIQRGHNHLHLAFLIAVGIVVLTIFFYYPFHQLRSAHDLKILIPKSMHFNKAVVMYGAFVIYWIFINVIMALFFHIYGGIGMEMLYTGYGWEKLKHLGFWKTSWILGLQNGIWIAPILMSSFRYPYRPFLSFMWILIFSVLFAPVRVYLRLISKSIICPALLVLLVNHFSNIFFYLFETQNHFLYGVYGLTGFVALIFVNLILFLKTRKTPLLEYEI